MNETILLEGENKKLLILPGLLFFSNGLFQIFNNTQKPIGLILGILLIIASAFYLFLFFIGFSPKSKYAPKVRVTDELIELKPGIMKSPEFLSWSDIREIHFSSFKILFKLNKDDKAFSYDTSSAQSIQIKRIIREVAESKNIEVIGG